LPFTILNRTILSQTNKQNRYGTAGFRDKAALLDSVFLRMGVLAALRARSTGKVVGLMVTASHNAVEDNGIKLVDPDGGMLAPEWEVYAAEMANATSGADATAVAKSIAARPCIAPTDPKAVYVHLARDTRPHSKHLADLAALGIRSCGGQVVDLGILTTPQLHHCVQHRNSTDPAERELATEAGYYAKLSTAFRELLNTARPGETPVGRVSTPVIVDCAFGVGGAKLPDVIKSLMPAKKKTSMRASLVRRLSGRSSAASAKGAALEPVPVLEILGRNLGDQEGDEERLNLNVGAEHVQKQRALPRDTIDLEADVDVRCASFDGDADRIVFYFVDKSEQMHLIDGDKIAALLGNFIQEHLAMLPEAFSNEVSVGVVQTAYANGSAMRYATDVMKVDAPLVKTGVKYLHHKAVDYDVGDYFEANGHGTVLFKPALVARLNEFATSPPNGTTGIQIVAAQRIVLLSKLLNQATGDAISDLLACEAVLALQGKSVQDWDKLYSELPSRQGKVKVADRTAIVTVADETRLTEPVALQEAIDKLVSQFTSGRAFVRPSGTEDVVRIYAEADTVANADNLAKLVSEAVFELGGGVK
jgi:phosphoacetylglucosamine mutase